MNMQTWNGARSAFNHAWLKPRFIVALSKAKKVLEGTVLDDTIWGDLTELFAEWPARRSDALRIFDDYPKAASPWMDAEKILGENIPPETAKWLAKLSHQHWAQGEQPEERLALAGKAMADLDAKICVVKKLLPEAHRKAHNGKLDIALVELQTAATSLGSAISALGSSRV